MVEKGAKTKGYSPTCLIGGWTKIVQRNRFNQILILILILSHFCCCSLTIRGPWTDDYRSQSERNRRWTSAELERRKHLVSVSFLTFFFSFLFSSLTFLSHFLTFPISAAFFRRKRNLESEAKNYFSLILFCYQKIQLFLEKHTLSPTHTNKHALSLSLILALSLSHHYHKNQWNSVNYFDQEF